MRIGFVTPWFGPELKGGAEQQAWQLATRLARRGHEVDALTTCCRSFLEDWAQNHLPEGSERIAGLVVRRFPVDPRDRAAFDALNAKLLSLPRAALVPGTSPVPEDEATVWTGHNINSRALEAYLADKAAGYDAFVFIPYLYGPTLRGVAQVAGKAWIQPCFHDECYAYLPDTAGATRAARGLIFNSEGEQQLAARLFGPAVWAKSWVGGGGIELDALDEHAQAPAPEPVRGRLFFLFLGRRDAGKGVELAIAAFRAWRQQTGRDDVGLVLAGPGPRDYADPEHGVLDLGLVSEPHRVALLRDCIAVVIPSPNESLSRVLYEAWYMRKPVVVRRSCDATRLPVAACGGGLAAETIDEWVQALDRLSREPIEGLAALGDKGRAHALEHADWERVIDRYESILAATAAPAARLKLRCTAGVPPAIHQLSPNFGYGDAISNEMVAVRALLRGAGLRSDIMVRHCDPALVAEVKLVTQAPLAPGDGLIYHHSIGSEVTPLAISHPGPKGLIYHNITPAEFFRPYRPDFAPLLREGREQLWSMARYFPVSVGDSAFNARELARFGFRDPQVLPLPIDPLTWDCAPNPDVMRRLQDGRRNIVFIGRVAPNKRQDRLVEAFAALRREMDVRLIIAGSAAPDDPFAQHVRARAAALGVTEDVVISGHCALADLHAFLRCAHVFLSFTEHEGFCVPLVEAMWFDVPVVALASSAVPETLADAGLMFSWSEGPAAVAALVHRVLEDPALRERIVARQRARRGAFTTASVTPALESFIDRMCARQHAAEAVTP